MHVEICHSAEAQVLCVVVWLPYCWGECPWKSGSRRALWPDPGLLHIGTMSGPGGGTCFPAGLVASRVFGLRAPRHHCSSMLLRPVVHQCIAGSEPGQYPKHDWVQGKLCLSPNILVIQVNINVCVKWDACPLGQSFDMSRWAKSGHSQLPRPGAGEPWRPVCLQDGSPIGFQMFSMFQGLISQVKALTIRRLMEASTWFLRGNLQVLSSLLRVDCCTWVEVYHETGPQPLLPA